MLNDKTILITGGTGSFGHNFLDYVLENFKPKKIIIFSRDENKQIQMRKEYLEYESILRFFIGNVRDLDRLKRAFIGVDYVIHAASLKDIDICEYNSQEAIKTNVIGAQNIIEAALDTGVKKVVVLSEDQSVNPVNLYGGVRYVADRLFVAANSYSGDNNTHFSVIRFGSIIGSENSLVNYYKELSANNEIELPVPDFRMTRFWVTIEKAISTVIDVLEKSNGYEIFIVKAPSYKVADLARVMSLSGRIRETGIMDGHKISEELINREEAMYSFEYEDYYVVYPNGQKIIGRKLIPNGIKLSYGFEYNSNNNTEWLSVSQIKELLTNIGVK